MGGNTMNSQENTRSGRLKIGNLTVAGKRTSVRLEPQMWEALHQVARREQSTIHEICTIIAAKKEAGTSLTAAIRVFLMLYFKAAATEDGHIRAGHGNIALRKRRAGLHKSGTEDSALPLQQDTALPLIQTLPGARAFPETAAATET